MDVTHAKALLTNPLDNLRLTSDGIAVSFRAAPDVEVVTLIINRDGTYTVGRSGTAGDHNFMEVADAYTRAAKFLRDLGLDQPALLCGEAVLELPPFTADAPPLGG